MIKNLSIFVSLFIPFFAVGSVSAVTEQTAKDSTLVLDLEQCVTIALDQNPTIKVADMEIQRVDYSRKETLGKLLPTIAFGGTYNRTLAKQTVYFNMDDMGGAPGGGGSKPSGEKKDDGIKMGRDNSFQVGFSASMPLIAPQLWKSIKLSESQILQNVEKARASKISLINQVENAYYTILLAHDSYNVIKKNYETALFNAEIFEGKFQRGTASEYDVLRSNVQVKNLEPQLLQAEIAVKQALLQLKVLMGIDAELNVEVANKLSDYEKDMYETTLNLDTALDNNTDLRSLDLQTEYLRKALKVQQMSWYPTLSVSANYNWTSLSDGSPFKNFRWSPYSVVGLSLSFPIFQGGQRYSKIKQADISVREMGYQRENLLKNLNMQVELQIDNIKKNVKQIASNAANVKQAQKAYDIMDRSLQIGAATYLDIRDAEFALTTAKLSYYQAIYNYLVANSDLKLLLGNADLESYQTENKK